MALKKMRPLKAGAGGNTVTEVTPNILNNHIGDMYYDNNTGYGYRFSHDDIEDAVDVGLTFAWVRITDQAALQALEETSRAQDTADGHRTLFLTEGALPPKVRTEGQDKNILTYW